MPIKQQVLNPIQKEKMKLVPNYENREFTDRKPLEVLVTDLTYVRVGRHWDYACFSIVLSNQEIIGLSISTRPEILLKGALQSIP